MNIIRKYWDAVYVYVLLLFSGFCICAGIFWTVHKALGYHPNLSWFKIVLFDLSQLIYLCVAIFIIHRNKKDSSYVSEHLAYVKWFIVCALLVQYIFILYLFPSVYVWECTFLFFTIITLLFDSKLLCINIVLYSVCLLAAHLSKPEIFLPLDEENLSEIIVFRIVIYTLTSFSIMVIVYFVERFLMKARENSEENVHLMEKQLEYYKDMELLDTELRKFRHDIKNHFLCIQTLLENEKTQELEIYFQDLQQSFSFEKKMFFSGNEIIDAIMHHDLPHRCEKEVDVTIYGSLPSIQTVSSMDLCTLFSNLLSNAIVSANQCIGHLNPQIIIHFSSGKSFFSISISNSFLVETQKKQKKTKDKNHGFGIHKIEHVIDKYGGQAEVNVEQNLVTIIVYLPI